MNEAPKPQIEILDEHIKAWAKQYQIHASDGDLCDLTAILNDALEAGLLLTLPVDAGGLLDTVIADMDGRIEGACEMLDGEAKPDGTVTKGYIDGMREAYDLVKPLRSAFAALQGRYRHLQERYKHSPRPPVIIRKDYQHELEFTSRSGESIMLRLNDLTMVAICEMIGVEAKIVEDKLDMDTIIWERRGTVTCVAAYNIVPVPEQTQTKEDGDDT